MNKHHLDGVEIDNNEDTKDFRVICEDAVKPDIGP